MIKKQLFRIKMVFMILLVTMVGTIIYTTQNRVLEKQIAALQREVRYWGYKVELSNNGSSGLASAGAFVWDTLGRQVDVNYSNAVEVSNNELAESVPVLVYHGIVPKTDRFSLPEKDFKEHMFALKRAGFQTVTLDDFQLFLEGKKSLPRKSFLLTFDDGRLDSYQGSDPILQALGYNAVMYVPAGKSLGPKTQNEYYIDSTHIREMVQSGRWEIESHGMQVNGGVIVIDSAGTKGNFLSNKMWLEDEERLETSEEYEARIRRELEESKHKLEQVTGREILSFSYPFGDYGQQGKNFEGASAVIKAALQSNYKMAFKQAWPLGDTFSSNDAAERDLYHLRRIEPDTSWNGEDLLQNIERGMGKALPYQDTFAVDNGWRTIWGTGLIENSSLRLKSSEVATGAFVFLDGTKHWQDYMYKVTLDREEGDYVSLFARIQNNENYIACTFSDEKVKIDQQVNGRLTNLVQVDNPVTAPSTQVTLGMLVEGSHVKCFVGRTVVAYDLVQRNFRTGGIGLRIWDESVGNASINIHNLEVFAADQVENLMLTMPVYKKGG